MRHRNLFHSRRKLSREHVERDDRGRFRVRENMRHFMHGIERIDIDEHAARLENAECGDRIGEPVWDLNRDPGSRHQVQRFAQIGGEGVRSAIDFSKAQACRHAVRHDGGERLGRRLPRRPVRRYLAEQTVGRRLDPRRHAWGIGGEPREGYVIRLARDRHFVVH